MVRTWCCHCWAWGSIPGQGTKIPQAVQFSQKKKKKEKEEEEKYSSSSAHDSPLQPSKGEMQKKKGFMNNVL